MPGFSCLHMRKIFPEIWETVILVFFCAWITHNRVILVFLCIIATCSDSDDEFSSTLVLHIIYTSEGYNGWKPWRNGRVPAMIVLLLFYSVVLCDDSCDVLIQNNHYGCIIMHNNGAMKIVNFMHAQTAETRCSFLCLWMPGTKLFMSNPFHGLDWDNLILSFFSACMIIEFWSSYLFIFQLRFYSWKCWNTSTLCFIMFIQTYWVLPSMNCNKTFSNTERYGTNLPTYITVDNIGWILCSSCGLIKNVNNDILLWHMAYRRQTPHSHPSPNHWPFHSLLIP